MRGVINLLIIVVVLFGLFVGVASATPAGSLTSSSTVNLKTGGSTIVQFNIRNDNSYCSVTGYYSLDSQGYGNVAGYIRSGTTASVSLTVQAPPKGSGSGSAQHVVYVKIVADKSFFCGGEVYYSQLPFVINYDDSEYRQQQQVQQQQQIAQSGANSALSSASNVIATASSSISNAQSAINDAKNIGADVNSAEMKLSSARSSLQNAQSKHSAAVSQYNAGNYNSATSMANDAANYAHTAASEADTAVTLANQAKQIVLSSKREAEEKLSKAQNTYNTVVSWIDSTNNMIAQASEMKIEITSFSKELEKVPPTLIDAKAEIDKAKARYDSREYSDSKRSSSASLEVTEKDLTVLSNIQYNIAMAAKEVVTRTQSNVTSNYESTVQLLESTKAKMTGDVYVSRNNKLDDAKDALKGASNLIGQGNSLLSTKDYLTALTSYKNAYSQLESTRNVSASISSSIAEEQAGIISKTIRFIKRIIGIFG